MKYLLTTTISLLPGIAFAAPPQTFSQLVNLFLDIIDALILVIFALALVVILWGITRAWILNAGDESSIEKGKQIALVGIIVLAVMTGIWGILAVLRLSLFGT